MESKPVIEIEGLTRRFGDKLAVDHLTLQVYRGEVFGFLGHNGAGKTTTIRLLNGVLTPNSGRAQVLDLDPWSDGPPLRRRTGVLTENPSLEERLSGRENLRIYADLYGIPETSVTGRVDELLGAFELADRADEKVGGCSKGMKQRLALARALLHSPEILFLDEPTAGLDPIAAHHVHGLIKRLSREQGRTVFICTHNLPEAEQICDRVAVLERGRLVALGTPAELGRHLGQGRGVEIELAVDGSSDALRALSSLPGTTCEDSTIRVPGVDREMIPEIVARLVASGIRLYRVTPLVPSLEDVYFALHGESEKERRAGIEDLVYEREQESEEKSP